MVYTYLDADDVIGLPKLDDPEMGGVGPSWFLVLYHTFLFVWPVAAIGQDEVIFHPSTTNEMV
jgi:hypothetical protein